MNSHIAQQNKLGLLAVTILLLVAVGVFFNGKVSKLLITGFHPHVNQNLIIKQLVSYKNQNWWLVDQSDVSHAIKQLPWVQSASVSMLWPDTIQLNIQEYTPVFRWNHQQLLSRSGASFQVSHTEYNNWDALPLLQGKPQDMPQFLHTWLPVDAVLKTLNFHPMRLHITPWGDWHIYLKNGSLILASESKIIKKINILASFIKEEYNIEKNRSFRIDLRGQGGVAIRPL